MEKVLEACGQLQLLGGEPSALREHVAEAARKLFTAAVSGVLVRDKANQSLGEASGAVKEATGKASLLAHARSFASQAIEHKRLLNFRFSYRDSDGDKPYYGLALPLVTSQSAAALLIVRRTAFSPAEVSAFSVLGNTLRMALDNAELATVQAAQQKELTQLLEISEGLGNASKLDSFLHNFVIRAAEFLGFERAFVAVVESGACRLHWGASKGTSSRLDLDVSAVARRLLENREYCVAEDVTQLPVPEKAQLLKWDAKARQYLGLPLVAADGHPLGMLGLLNKKIPASISPEDIRRARALAVTVGLALESGRNVQLSELHKKRAEDLMDMALELGSALRLPDFVKNFTERVAQMMGAGSAVLALAQGNKVESVGFFAAKPERELLRRLNAALSSYAEHQPGLKITGGGSQALGSDLTAAMGWHDVTLVRLEGTESDLLGILALADLDRELLPGDLNLLQALIVHGSVSLENSRLFTRITQSSRQWAEIFDSISDFIVVHDEHHHVLKVNRSLAEFIGVRPAELIGLHMRALTPVTFDTPDPCPFCRDQAHSDEYLHPLLERSYLVSTSRIHAALDEGAQTVHVLKDITDRREAERRYRELFDNVQEGVFFSSPEGHFIEVNDALVRMLGYQTREDVLKLDLNTQVYLSTEQRDEILRQLSEHGSVRNFEVSLCRRDGSLIHALENAFVVRDGQNRILQYRGVFLDISEVKNFQAQLQRERDFTSKILNNTQTMIVVADTAGLVSYANRRCYEGGAFEQGDLVGHRLDRIISPSHQQAFTEGFESALHGMQVDNLELMIVRSNGSPGKFSVNLSPMRDEAGDVTSVVVLMTDITDAAMIQAKLMHTEKMAAVGQLVSGVAHEVNNPLTAIMGFSDLLMENPEVPGSARKDLQVILEEAQRTKEIVQNLLSFARQRPPQRQRLQINDILRKTIALRAYDFANHGVEIVERFEERLPELIGDSHQLQQVFLNILNNAYDAVRATGRPGMIAIETLQDTGWIEVLFRDNGEGIRHPERIFDPFFTTKEVGQGTGLGLSICYGIVREHEGEILCANNQDMPGATFSVRLPVRSKADLKVMTAAGARQ
ncbi:MAG TPA: PAS domain S-box protein [Candidatus Limnocylindrales bacterium]|nr:PAS domain S-box protein [Candidatus Limnocylindrales bacterium]